MTAKRDFTLKRPDKPLSPEKLMHILSRMEGDERARETYRRLTGEEPPEGEVKE